ncbi:MAG: hypothetical protein OEO23_04005, partial [Gemmatimonadota bacterium]|nr:hypothetical protein [Gemmatimonadota bacterium]
MSTTLDHARSSAQRSVGRLVHRLGFSPHLPPGPEGEGVSRPSLDFVVIGAQKAGSTFLHHAILHHPQLFMPVGEV